MPVKCIRLEIIKPYTEPGETPVPWAELGQVLRDLRYVSSKIANFVVQKSFQWEIFRREHKEQHGAYPSPKDHKDKVYLYPMIRERFPEVASSVANQIRHAAEKVWKASFKDVMYLRKSIPSFRLNFPITLCSGGYSIAKTDNSYIVSAGLMPQGSPRTRYEFIVKAGEPSKKAILDRIINGTYKKGALQIVSDQKKKWYVIIPYTFEATTEEALDPDKIMGIDLGIVNAVYWAFNDSPKRGYIAGGEIEDFRKGVVARRKSIQRQGKQCGEGRIGHGRKRRLQPIEVLAEKEQNFRHTTNHRYAKKIVQEAYNHGCGTIQMEDLSGINELSTFLKKWSYFDLQSKIIEKATVLGIKTVKINPEYTSQRCSHCGHICRENRPDQATFLCKECGASEVADYNAAQNIATFGIEEIIKNTRGDSASLKRDSEANASAV